MTEEKYSIEGELDWDEIGGFDRPIIIRPMGLRQSLVEWLDNLPAGLAYYRVRITVEVLHDQPLAGNPYTSKQGGNEP